MEHNDQRTRFINEVWQRFLAVQDWAIANWPDPAHPLSSSDFVHARQEILGLGDPRTSPRNGNQNAAEPEDGGPQYVDVTPTPWP
jgi:hypothetical protein